ncbi:MAG: FG-GAP-like repeat-containing protein [Bacteriovoracia bacterium]
MRDVSRRTRAISTFFILIAVSTDTAFANYGVRVGGASGNGAESGASRSMSLSTEIALTTGASLVLLNPGGSSSAGGGTGEPSGLPGASHLNLAFFSPLALNFTAEGTTAVYVFNTSDSETIQLNSFGEMGVVFEQSTPNFRVQAGVPNYPPCVAGAAIAPAWACALWVNFDVDSPGTYAARLRLEPPLPGGGYHADIASLAISGTSTAAASPARLVLQNVEDVDAAYAGVGFVTSGEGTYTYAYGDVPMQVPSMGRRRGFVIQNIGGQAASGLQIAAVNPTGFFTRVESGGAGGIPDCGAIGPLAPQAKCRFVLDYGFNQQIFAPISRRWRVSATDVPEVTIDLSIRFLGAIVAFSPSVAPDSIRFANLVVNGEGAPYAFVAVHYYAGNVPARIEVEGVVPPFVFGHVPSDCQEISLTRTDCQVQLGAVASAPGSYVAPIAIIARQGAAEFARFATRLEGVTQAPGTLVADGGGVVDFGTVGVGARGQRSVTIRNPGTEFYTATVEVDQVRVTGAAGFSVVGHNCPAGILPGGFCRVDLEYSATGAGAALANLEVSYRAYHGAAVQELTVSLSAHGESAGEGCLTAAPACPSNIATGPNLRFSRCFEGASGEMLGAETRTIASAGDFNGDGFPDIAVTSPYATGAGTAGHLYVYSGRSGCLLYDYRHPEPGSRFGISVTSIGDWNGDGRADLAVGADHPGDSARGKVLLFSKSSSVPFAVLDAEVAGAWAPGAGTDRFGFVVTAVDTNRDGVRELLISAPEAKNAGGDETGAVYWLSGLGGEWRRLEGDRNTWFGQDVEAVGDLNADGFDDFAVSGAYLSEAGLPPQVKVYSGNPQAASPDGGFGALFSISPPVTPTYSYGVHPLLAVASAFGHKITALGNFLGTAGPGFLVGAPGYDGTSNAGVNPAANNFGAAYAYRGAGQMSAFHETRPSADSQAFFGAASAVIGDLNRDGASDLAVGAPQYDGYAVNRPGRLFLYRGVLAGGTPTLFANGIVTGEQAGDRFGSSVVALGDLDGDGRREFAVSAPLLPGLAGAYAGRVYVFSEP